MQLTKTEFMLLSISILFITALAAGLAVFLVPELDKKKFKSILSFSGAYLFSITVIHILPELFHESHNPIKSGIFVLLGFFLQMLLEYFTSGVEHGHIHHHHESTTVPYFLLISLGIHSFLEGTLLVHPSSVHGQEGAGTLMFGLIMHKMPEAFALMSVLILQMKNKSLAILLLAIFALTSPIGMLMSNALYNYQLITAEVFEILFALVAGNFLHISTTIFFESSPEHKFKAKKLLLSVSGAGMAILAEYFMGH